MSTRVVAVVLLAFAVLGGAPAQNPVVIFETTLGTIEIEVDAARAPSTAANFLRYVDAGLYDSGRFHRTVRPDTETRQDHAPSQCVEHLASGDGGEGAKIKTQRQAAEQCAERGPVEAPPQRIQQQDGGSELNGQPELFAAH